MESDETTANSSSNYYKHLAMFWTDILRLMSNKPQALVSTGPMRALAENSKKVTAELVEMNDDLIAFNNHLTEYYTQLVDTWTVAQKKVNVKVSDVPHDVEQAEAYKRIWIDIFDNDFTELFDSLKFGSNYGKLVSKELELVRHWNNVTNVVLQSVNLPSKEELDEVYREIHSLKKQLRILAVEVQRLRRASAANGDGGGAGGPDSGTSSQEPQDGTSDAAAGGGVTAVPVAPGDDKPGDESRPSPDGGLPARGGTSESRADAGIVRTPPRPGDGVRPQNTEVQTLQEKPGLSGKPSEQRQQKAPPLPAQQHEPSPLRSHAAGAPRSPGRASGFWKPPYSPSTIKSTSKSVFPLQPPQAQPQRPTPSAARPVPSTKPDTNGPPAPSPKTSGRRHRRSMRRLSQPPPHHSSPSDRPRPGQLPSPQPATSKPSPRPPRQQDDDPSKNRDSDGKRTTDRQPGRVNA